MTHVTRPRGRLELITGGMFAGKTTELMRRLYASRESLAICPANDERSGTRWLRTHDGREFPAATAKSPADFDALARDAEAGFTIGIDECHSYDTHALLDAVIAMLYRGVRVIAAGLRYDYRGVPLRSTAALEPLADSVTLLRARCRYCADQSSVADYQHCVSGRIVNGGANDYVPVCWHHLNALSLARDPAETSR